MGLTKEPRTIMKMINAIGGAVLGLACAAVLALPAAASAPTTYTTTLTQVLPGPSAGEFDGKLQLTISPDGIINGYYIPQYDGGFVPVTGGIVNGSYWLDIDVANGLRVNGRVGADGSLIGTATTVPDASLDGGQPFTDTYSFVAKPA